MAEFGWYIGHRAESKENVAHTIEKLNDAADYVHAHRVKEGAEVLPDSAKENNALYGKIVVGYKKARPSKPRRPGLPPPRRPYNPSAPPLAALFALTFHVLLLCGVRPC